MTNEHLEQHKETLKAELKTLEAELATVGRKNPSNPADWEAVEPDMNRDRADETEVADNIEEYETNTAVLKQLETRLGEVTSALDRIENGGYGLCTICGTEIEHDRLEANPAATTCKAHME